MHTQTRPVLGGRGDTRTGSIFVGWRRRWRDKKPAASTLLRSVSLDSTFFPFALASPPNRRSFHSVRLFFCCHVASAALRSRPFRPSFPLSLSLSLPVATVLSSSLLFSSFSHFAKLAAVLPRLPRSSLSLAPVPTTAEAIEHASDGDARYRRVHLTRIERKKEEKGGSRDGGTETDVFEARKRSELRPSTVESSRVESSRAESSRAEPDRIGSGRVELRRVESSKSGKEGWRSSRRGDGYAKGKEAERGRGKGSRARERQRESGTDAAKERDGYREHSTGWAKRVGEKG